MENDAETKVCQVKMHDGKPCGREVFKKPSFFTDTCVFHLGAVSEKREEFHKELKLYIEQVETNDALKVYDFRGFVFPSGSKFLGKTFLKPVIFYEAQFEETVRFTTAVFKEEANFGLVKFKSVDFNAARFCVPAHFWGSGFTGVVSFGSQWGVDSGGVGGPQKTRFEHDVNFSGCNFQQVTFFSGVSFNGTANFHKSKFRGETTFATTMWLGGKGKNVLLKTTFSKEANFSEAEFHSRFRVANVDFKGHVNFSGAKFEASAYFKGGNSSKCFYGQESDFSSVQVGIDAEITFEKNDLSRVRFLDTDLEKITFRDVQWYESGTRKRALYDEFRALEEAGAQRDYEKIAENYRQLVINYEKKRDYEVAEDFHIGEMEMRRKKKGLERIPLWLEKILESINPDQPHSSVKDIGVSGWEFVSFFVWRVRFQALRKWSREWVNVYALYRILSYYGTSYWQALRVLLLMVTGFSLIFLWNGFQPSRESMGLATTMIEYDWFPDSEHKLAGFGQWFNDYKQASLYTLSIITFQRERFYQPADGWWPHFWLFVSVIVLTSQVALVLLAIRRRFKR